MKISKQSSAQGEEQTTKSGKSEPSSPDPALNKNQSLIKGTVDSGVADMQIGGKF